MAREYNWFPQYIYPYESQWSLVQKFSLWNAFRLQSTRRAIGEGQWTGKNMAAHRIISTQKAVAATHLDEVSISQGITTHYLLRDESSLIFRNLRFCPECLAKGYHSSLHQLAIIERCPAHQQELQIHCTCCKSLISMEAVGRNFENPYTCPVCMVPFCIDTNRGPAALSFKEREIYIAEGKSIESLRKNREKIISYNSLNYHNLVQERKSGEQIRQYWADICLVNTSKHGHLSHTSVCIKIDHTGPKLWNAWSIYRAIRRYIFNRFIQRHRKCLNEIQKLGAAYAGMDSIQPLNCPEVHAYLMWRMYWEKRVTLLELHFDPDRSINRLWIKKSELHEQEHRRIFAHECIDIFLNLLKWARDLNEKGVCRILTPEEIESLTSPMSNWCVVKDETHGSSTIHIWRDLTDMQILTQDKSSHLKKVRRSVEAIQEQLHGSRHIML